MAKPKLAKDATDEEIRAIAHTKYEIDKLNRMLDKEMPDCPKLKVTGYTNLGDTPDIIARFNVELRTYIRNMVRNALN